MTYFCVQVKDQDLDKFSGGFMYNDADISEEQFRSLFIEAVNDNPHDYLKAVRTMYEEHGFKHIRTRHAYCGDKYDLLHEANTIADLAFDEPIDEPEPLFDEYVTGVIYNVMIFVDEDTAITTSYTSSKNYTEEKFQNLVDSFETIDMWTIATHLTINGFKLIYPLYMADITVKDSQAKL